MNKLRYTPAQVIAALDHTRGMIALAAERLGCDVDTVYNYIKRYATVAAELKRQRERTTDIAELKLYQSINEGEPWAVQFYLKTQGKTRGYVERLDLSILVQQAATQVGKEFDMTPQDILDEAKLFMLEEHHAS